MGVDVRLYVQYDRIPDHVIYNWSAYQEVFERLTQLRDEGTNKAYLDIDVEDENRINVETSSRYFPEYTSADWEVIAKSIIILQNLFPSAVIHYGPDYHDEAEPITHPRMVEYTTIWLANKKEKADGERPS